MHYGLREKTLSSALVNFLGEVCPGSRPFRNDSAEKKKTKAKDPGR
jgi:hypothetical protein